MAGVGTAYSLLQCVSVAAVHPMSVGVVLLCYLGNPAVHNGRQDHHVRPATPPGTGVLLFAGGGQEGPG